ncbi:hypothetical protein L9G16_20970, partial [Shewanella sp. A25]|nr:hypothetical protein [Shewanella shenzhenensis]
MVKLLPARVSNRLRVEADKHAVLTSYALSRMTFHPDRVDRLLHTDFSADPREISSYLESYDDPAQLDT